MVPITPPAPGSILIPTTGPVPTPASPLPEVPAYNLVEVNVGANFVPGHASQAQLGLSLTPLPNLRISANYATDFLHNHNIMVQAGPRIRVADFMNINILGVAGIGILNDDPSQQGQLQETITRNGVRYLLGASIQVEGNLNRNIGLYFSLTALAALNNQLQATPGRLMTSEDINPTELVVLAGAGLRWGFAPRGTREVAPHTPPVTPPVTAPTPPNHNDTQRIQQMENDFNTRIDDLQNNFNQQLEERERSRVNGAINNAQTSINQLRTRVAQLSRGINESNLIANKLTRVADTLSAPNTTLSVEDRTTTTQTLDQLEHALNSANTSDADESLRMALRYIPNSDATRGNRYVNTIITRLTTLESNLRSRNEEALADRVHNIKARCERFATANPQTITLQDLQRDVDTMEGSVRTLETLFSGSSALQGNANWTNIRTALNQARDEVGLMVRTTVAYNNIYTLLSNGGGFFVGVIGNPQNARSHFEQTRTFIQNLGSIPATQGVVMARMYQQFGHFTQNLLYNLNYFIQNDPRVRANPAQWRAAVQAAHDLACQIDLRSEACNANMGSTSAPVRPPRPPAPANPSNPAAGIASAQSTAQSSATAARRDANTAQTAFDTVPGSASNRANLQNLLGQIQEAATAAEAANTASRAPGVTLTTAQQQAREAQRQAGIAHNKLAELQTGVRAAQAQPQLQPTAPTGDAGIGHRIRLRPAR